MRSRYCRTTSLDVPPGRLPYLAYSSLSGNIALIDAACHSLLAEPGVDTSGVTERLAFLAARGFWSDDPARERRTAAELISGIVALRQQQLQLLFVFHPDAHDGRSPEAMVDAAAASACSLVARRRPRRCHLCFWIFDPRDETLFQRAVERLRPALAGAGEIVCIVNTNGMVPLRLRPLRARLDGRLVLKVVVDRHFMSPYASLDCYLERLYGFIENVAQQGQTSTLLLDVSRKSVDFFADELLERFLVEGLNRAVVTSYYLIATRPKLGRADFFCDLDGVDWELWTDLVPKVASRRRYRLLSFYGGGVIARLQELLSLKKTLRPDIHFCPIVPNSLVFDLAGNVWACPKSPFLDGAQAGREAGIAPLGRFLPRLELDEERLSAWRDRHVGALPRCRACPDAFICGGGCPREAWLEGGQPRHAVCQPVEAMLALGVRENLEYVSRKFGPAARVQP